jgi:hypothetical protein
VPLKWNDHLKKWMGHDQITVETVFKYPGQEGSPDKSKKKEGAKVHQLQEHKEYMSYVDQFEQHAKVR